MQQTGSFVHVLGGVKVVQRLCARSSSTIVWDCVRCGHDVAPWVACARNRKLGIGKTRGKRGVRVITTSLDLLPLPSMALAHGLKSIGVLGKVTAYTIAMY